MTRMHARTHERMHIYRIETEITPWYVVPRAQPKVHEQVLLRIIMFYESFMELSNVFNVMNINEL